MKKVLYQYSHFMEDVPVLDKNFKDKKIDLVYGIFQGSLFYASYMSKRYKIPMGIVKFQRLDGDDKSYADVKIWVDKKWDIKAPENNIIIIDDIIDTGITMVTAIQAVINQHRILDPSLITVVGIFNKLEGIEAVLKAYPTVNILMLREADSDVWIDFFTEGILSK